MRMQDENLRREPGARLPDFIVVGAARTGTTWLSEVLQGHVCLPRGTKETDFFIKRYAQGLQWYRSHFSGCAPSMRVGEICPTYFDSDLARERIAKDLPGCRIVCIVRDPVDRLYSFFKLMRVHGWTKLAFEESFKRHRQMLDSNRYVFHIEAWRAKFGADRVCVMVYDDLEADGQGFVDQLCDFIGAVRFDITRSPVANQRLNVIPDQPRYRKLAQNSRHAAAWLSEHRMYGLLKLWQRSPLWRLCFGGGEPFPALAPELELQLREYFRDGVEALEKLLGRDLSHWKAPPQRVRLAAAASRA